MSKLFFFDLETTGVRHWKNGIHQISGSIIIDGQKKETFNFKVRPNPDAIVEDEALEIANVSRETIRLYPDMKSVYDQIITMLSKYVNKFNRKDKFHLVGFNNSSFDNQFFRAFFAQNGDNYFGSWFWSDSIDVMGLASFVLRSERVKLKDFKLKTVAAYFGIPVDESKLHDALYDIELTEGIYNSIVSKYFINTSLWNQDQ